MKGRAAAERQYAALAGRFWAALDFTAVPGAIVLSITPHNLHKLSVEVPQKDLCAHGGVMITRGSRVLIDQRTQEWTLSAAALTLLRTLNEDHTADHRVGEHLFPHCGHAMYAQGDSHDVLIIGCPSGLDFEVRHREQQVVSMLKVTRRLCREPTVQRCKAPAEKRRGVP